MNHKEANMGTAKADTDMTKAWSERASAQRERNMEGEREREKSRQNSID